MISDIFRTEAFLKARDGENERAEERSGEALL
jgi:hypothetical protein